MTAVRDGAWTTLSVFVLGITLVAAIASFSVLRYRAAVLHAQENVLRHNLHVLREMLKQHRSDHEKHPSELQDLVHAGYTREIPIDPMTGSSDTWTEMRTEIDGISVIVNVYSGAAGNDTTDQPYASY